MDIFRFRDHLTRDYAEYVRSFIRIATADVADVVDRAIEDQLLWPEPIVQLNPSYRPGDYIRDLVAEGTLHETSGRVFRRGKDNDLKGLCDPLRWCQDQVEAPRSRREQRRGRSAQQCITPIAPERSKTRGAAAGTMLEEMAT